MFEVRTRFEPGQRIKIKALCVEGKVWQVMCMPGSVTTYDCFWWWDGERKASVLTEDEIEEV